MVSKYITQKVTRCRGMGDIEELIYQRVRITILLVREAEETNHQAR